MEATNLTYDALKNSSCNDSKIDIKNETFENWEDSSSNMGQGYSSLSLAVKEQMCSNNPQDTDLKDEKLPTTNLAINTSTSSNSEVIQPERNNSLQINEILNSQENEAENASLNIREIKATLEDENKNNVNFTSKISIVKGHISDKLSQNSNQETDNKASGKSRKTSDKEKNKREKSHSLHLSSKIRNEETYGAKYKLDSAITKKNQEGCNTPVSYPQKVRFDPWEEASCSRGNRARNTHMPYDRNTEIRTYLSSNKNTDKKSKYSSKNDYSKSHSSDRSNSGRKNYYNEAKNAFNLSHKDKQYIPHSIKSSSVEENRSVMIEPFSYNGKNIAENSPVLNDKNLSQKSNEVYNDILNRASGTDNEVVMSSDIDKVNPKTVFDDKGDVNTSSKENGEEKSKNECGNTREISTSNKRNEEVFETPSPLTTDIKVTDDCGEKDKVLHVSQHQELLMPLNKNNFDSMDIEDTTGVEKAQIEEVVILSDTQRKNINEFLNKEVLETSNTKEKEKLRNKEFVDSSRPSFDLRNERSKSVEVINVAEDQPEKCYSCPHCSFTTNNKVNLNLHSYSHLNANLSGNSHYDRHRINKNPILHYLGKKSSKKSLELKCYLCGYKCMRKKKLEKHTFENHFSKKFYKCYSCSYESSDMILLKRHLETHFENDPCSAATCHRRPCDNVTRLQEMGSRKRPISDLDEDHNRHKRGKFDYLQDGKIENIMRGIDKLMNKMNGNITLFRQAIISQVNELGAVVSCLKTNMDTTVDANGLRDSLTIQPSTSKRQQTPNCRCVCLNCEPQPSTSDNTFGNLHGDERDIFSYDSSSTN